MTNRMSEYFNQINPSRMYTLIITDITNRMSDHRLSHILEQTNSIVVFSNQNNSNQ